MGSKKECSFDCLHCEYSDCIRSGEAIVAAQPQKGRKKKTVHRPSSLAYCYNAKFKPYEHTDGLREWRMAKPDLEAMLEHQFGRKLEPVRCAIK